MSPTTIAPFVGSLVSTSASSVASLGALELGAALAIFVFGAVAVGVVSSLNRRPSPAPSATPATGPLTPFKKAA